MNVTIGSNVIIRPSLYRLIDAVRIHRTHHTPSRVIEIIHI